ncbi:unnamed protein product [Coregonus sp. 'balchen']|nr:unnamed protein product [Coregonus sp. 'balchen']
MKPFHPLVKTLIRNWSLVWQYTTLLERLLDLEAETRDCFNRLYNIRQHEAFLKVILVSCKGMGFMRSSHFIKLSHECFFKSILFHKDSLPILLLQFFTRQMSFYDEMVLLSILSNMMSQLFPDGQLEDILVSVIKTDEQRMKESSEGSFKIGIQPDEYIARVAEKTKWSPELIQLLQQFACVTPHSEIRSGERQLVKPIMKCDSSTQMDTHLLETNIVNSYEWSEWELRRKAIKLANLRSKVTPSMQTNLIHLRRKNVTQTYLPKDGACQSKRNVFLAGLQGGKTNTTHMMRTNLTRSVD